MNETTKDVKLGKTREIELPKLDISKYIGRKSKIAGVQEKQGQFGFFIMLESAELDQIDTKEGKKPLKASKIFSLQTDKDGVVGWGKNTKLGQYLKKMGVDHYLDLVGKQIIIQSMTRDDGQEFLTF